MATPDISEALLMLQQQPSLSILSLSEPILGSHEQSSNNRTSNVSSTSDLPSHLTPTSLQADLAHYKELFSKLRFSYVEQVTKERFLKAIVADPPELASASQNVELETRLVNEKAQLKGRKEEVGRKIHELETLGRALARRHETLQLNTNQLAALPQALAELSAQIASLVAAQTPQSTNPALNLSLPATQDILSSKEAELEALDRQLSDLQSALPRQKRLVAGLQAELVPLEARKREAVEAAALARRKRAAGGAVDELEERGRWLKGVDTGLRAMLEV